ncbi:MAG: CinA family nicotinamide mononucleotide deamidase-related protein [Bacillota bacterium]|jgi:nicotinamide-nucleotide amidase
MIAEIISVGSELLLGDIVNTNAQYLAQQMAKLGIIVQYQTSVGDNSERVKKAIDIAFERADTVIMTGGLGPTKDDLTKEMLAEYFAKELVWDAEVYQQIKNRMCKYGVTKVSESNKKQAYVPQDCIVLYNEHGTAPGCIIEGDEKTAVLLPGPPKEMQWMFEEYVLDYLRKFSDKMFVSVNIKLEGIGESMAADKIDHLLDNSNPTVAPYAKADGTLLRITASATNQKEALEMIEPILEEIKRILKGNIKEVIMPS